MRSVQSAGDVRAAYRPEIDGLRALSVIAVIINHFDKDLLPNGHLGVDVFFVISGYVITGSLFGLAGRSAGDFLLAFYTKRIKRILPPLVVCVAVASVLVCLFDPDPKAVLTTGVTSLFGVSNLHLWKTSTDYFATPTELNAFTHTWSLGVEEQFYLLFPLLLWLVVLRRGPGASRTKALLPIGALLVLSLAAFLLLSDRNAAAAFYLMPARFWELAVGCVLFMAAGERTGRGRVARVTASVALALLAGALLLPFRFSIPATVAVVALTAVLIVTTAPGGASFRLLTRPGVVYVGAISYSLYLWHWIVLSISRWTIGVHWWSAPIQLAAMFALAAASYRFVELPLRYAQWSAIRWRTIAYGLGCTAMVAATLQLVVSPGSGHLFLGRKVEGQREVTGAIPARNPDVANRASELVDRCNMTPHHIRGPHSGPKPVVDRAFVARCVGERSTPKKMVLVGDSFAQVSAPHLAVLAHELGYEFHVLSGYGCPYPFVLTDIKGAAAKSCEEVDQEWLYGAVMDALSPGDLLVVRLYLEKRQYVDYDVKGGRPPADAYDAAIVRMARDARQRGAAFVLVGSNPSMSPPQMNALRAQWYNRLLARNATTIHPSDNAETSYYHALDGHLRRFVPTIGGASYFSLRHHLCGPDSVCTAASDRGVLYSDAEHITGSTHDLLYPELFTMMTTARSASAAAPASASAR